MKLLLYGKLRHPLLVWQHQHEQGSAVIPVDLLIQPQIRVGDDNWTKHRR
jgi:hypothetical protein